MADRPPFSMLRAAFWLLAILLGAEMATTMSVIAGCAWTVLVERAMPVSACAKAGDSVREGWSEALAAILALLLAAKSGNGGPPKPPP
jgi:hypothetical protein